MTKSKKEWRNMSAEEQRQAIRNGERPLDRHRKSIVNRLKSGVESWNVWRASEKIPSLIGVDLNETRLMGVDLREIDLSNSTFIRSDLTDATLFGATMDETDFQKATMFKTTLDKALLTQCNMRNCMLDESSMVLTRFLSCDMTGASLKAVDFTCTVLDDVDLNGANLTGSRFHGTVFENVDLSQVTGLEDCWHESPSVIDFQSLKKSGSLPISFLRGIGLPETLIDYLPSILNSAIQHYSCFISYSTRDQQFADRLHADLQASGVRCWFAPHDLQIGKKIWEEIDKAIRVRDKVFLILSRHSIESEWVEDEVNKAFEEERKRGQSVLFPVRLDDAVMVTDKGWAAKLRNRHIGDFSSWERHSAYRESFERVLRDLRQN